MARILTVRYISGVLALCGTTLALAAGLRATRSVGPAKSSAPSSIQETMLLLVDPSADALWESVGTIITIRGTQHRAPHTDAQWLKVSGYAESLVRGARNLQRTDLKIGANPRSHLADYDVPGARTADQIGADINADPARFREAAIRLEDAAKLALTATRNHDVQRLFDAGGIIDEACEHCHQTYWYPRQRLTGPAHK